MTICPTAQIGMRDSWKLRKTKFLSKITCARNKKNKVHASRVVFLCARLMVSVPPEKSPHRTCTGPVRRHLPSSPGEYRG
jgi:hypothetical protein